MSGASEIAAPRPQNSTDGTEAPRQTKDTAQVYTGTVLWYDPHKSGGMGYVSRDGSGGDAILFGNVLRACGIAEVAAEDRLMFEVELSVKPGQNGERILRVGVVRAVARGARSLDIIRARRGLNGEAASGSAAPQVIRAPSADLAGGLPPAQSALSAAAIEAMVSEIQQRHPEAIRFRGPVLEYDSSRGSGSIAWRRNGQVSHVFYSYDLVTQCRPNAMPRRNEMVAGMCVPGQNGIFSAVWLMPAGSPTTRPSP